MNIHTKSSSKFIVYSLAFVILFGFQQCSSKDKSDVVPDDNNPVGTDCDATNVSFSGTVLPIINANCLSCHSGSSPNGGIRLENIANIRTQGAIAAGSYGSLYGVISHSSGNNPMPKNLAKLSDCDIKKIKSWIDAGMPDN